MFNLYAFAHCLKPFLVVPRRKKFVGAGETALCFLQMNSLQRYITEIRILVRKTLGNLGGFIVSMLSNAVEADLHVSV